MIKVILFGGGNVATHLANEFIQNKEIKLIQMYNRNISKIKHFKSKTLITNNLENILDADIYIISISDNAVADFSSKLILKNKLVVHTSGTISLNELKSISNKGVFYPLQTFSKNKKLQFDNIPICIEAEHEKDLILLKKLANSITKEYYHLNSEQRESLHIAAVFVNNFINHLYHIGHTICNEANIPFNILKPLIKETASKITTLNPIDAQTGPAVRKDTKTIHKHLEKLSNINQEIYTLLSNSIKNTHGEKL